MANHNDHIAINSSLLRCQDTLLVVVDMQEPFLRGVYEREKLLDNVLLLIQSAQIMAVPVIATTQYCKRMGPVVPEIASALLSAPIVDKLSFSCAADPDFQAALESAGRKQLLLCGVETHICISQSAADLHSIGNQVHVAADAVSSRSLEKHKLGMERIRDNGILPCGAEAAIYELLRTAAAPDFKTVLQLIKLQSSL